MPDGTTAPNTLDVEKGQYIGDSFRLFNRVSAFGTIEKDISSPNCSTSVNRDCTTNFEVRKVGMQYYLTKKTDDYQTRLIFGGAYQKIISLDNSLNAQSQGAGLLGYVKYSYTGAPFKRKKKREPAVENTLPESPLEPISQSQTQPQP